MKTAILTVLLLAAAAAAIALTRVALGADKPATRPVPLDAVAAACTVEPTTVLIFRPVPEAVVFGAAPINRALPGQPGTVVELTVRAPLDNRIVGVDLPESKLAAFGDDRGTDLLAAPKPTPGVPGAPGAPRFPAAFARNPGFNSFFSHVVGDGKAALIEVESPGLPAKGATALRLKGTLAVRFGGTRDEQTLTNIELKKGKLNVKGQDVAISTVGEQSYPSNAPGGFQKGATVTLRLNDESADTFIGATFSEADDTPIEQSQSGTSALGNAGIKTVTYFLKSEGLKRVSITFSFWTELRTVMVPLNLEAGLGG